MFSTFVTWRACYKEVLFCIDNCIKYGSARLQGKHFADYLPASGSKLKPTKLCHVCYARGV